LITIDRIKDGILSKEARRKKMVQLCEGDAFVTKKQERQGRIQRAGTLARLLDGSVCQTITTREISLSVHNENAVCIFLIGKYNIQQHTHRPFHEIQWDIKITERDDRQEKYVFIAKRSLTCEKKNAEI